MPLRFGEEVQEMLRKVEKMKNRIDVIKIDVEGLTMALEDAELITLHYLDLETGEVVRISELFPPPEYEKLMKAIEEGLGKRYLEAPRMLSQEAYEDMVDFMNTVEDNHLKELLEIAISGRGAFRRFKDVLLRYPGERKRWFEFKESRLRERTAEWLMAEGIMEECEIEITEVSREDILNQGIEEEWKEIGPVACLECGCKEGFKPRYFIISRLPEDEREEKRLKEHMWVRFGVRSFGVNPCVLGDGRSVLDAAKCMKCGSQEIVFDF